MKNKIIVDENKRLKTVSKQEYKKLKLKKQYMFIYRNNSKIYYYVDEKLLDRRNKIFGYTKCDDDMIIVRDFMSNNYVFSEDIRMAQIFSLPYKIIFSAYNALPETNFVNCSLYLKSTKISTWLD